MALIKNTLREFVSRAGYDLNRTFPPLYGDQQQLSSFIETVSPNTMLPRDRLRSLYEQVVYCERSEIPGAFVECGVWKGGAAGMMALAAGGRNGRRAIHLFDAFTDICEPDPEKDGELAFAQARKIVDPAGRLKPMTGFYDNVGGHGTLEECRTLIEDKIGYPEELVSYHVGWFQETLPITSHQIGPIAILRLDGDWYDSTLTCLEHLYDHVVTGGFVILDDYGTYEGCRKAVDEFMQRRDIDAYLQDIDAGCRYFVKT